MKVRLSQTHVELTPETIFERDVMHHLHFHGVKSIQLSDCRLGVLNIEVRPERLYEFHYNDAEHANAQEAAMTTTETSAAVSQIDLMTHRTVCEIVQSAFSRNYELTDSISIEQCKALASAAVSCLLEQVQRVRQGPAATD